jgi:hypothetical protein
MDKPTEPADPSTSCADREGMDFEPAEPDLDPLPFPEDWGEGDEYGPVPLRYRHDGWVPDRQLEFIERLAECGCVSDAARSVGMSRASAYALRRREDAQAFRLAWDAAMDAAVARLADAALARAIHGVPVPIFQRGEQVGERRHYDERLTMFLLRYRDPSRYGKWIDRADGAAHQDGPSLLLGYRIGRMLRAGWRAFDAAFRGEESPPPEAEVFGLKSEELKTAKSAKNAKKRGRA